MDIKFYNSTHSLNAYDLGDACAFFVHNYDSDRFENASEEVISKYSHKITEIINDQTYSANDGKWLNFTRVVGIVIDKHEATDSKDIDKITAMFKTDDGRYILNKYVVNSNDIFTNNKDNVPPAAVLYATQEELEMN